jgi:hypothetical protein
MVAPALVEAVAVLGAAAPPLLLVVVGPVQVATPPCPRQAPLFVLDEVVVPSLQVPVAVAWAAIWLMVPLTRSRPKARPSVGNARRRRMETPRSKG